MVQVRIDSVEEPMETNVVEAFSTRAGVGGGVAWHGGMLDGVVGCVGLIFL